MKIVLASYGTRGDIEPSLVVARELQRRGHELVMAVPPDSVEFTEAGGLTAVPYGLESQAWLDIYRNFWTSFFGGFWHVQKLRGLWREMWDLSDQCWRHMNTTLLSLADGADLIFAGQCAFLEEKAERRCNAFGDCNENELHRSSGVVNSGKANVIGLSPGP
ncbi:hypothetical protein A5714_08060 [Mycobacterium sp. E2462]|nr:hypothetical protein A5714_08060 [Mycobacterium sp. E2462]